MGRYFVLDDTGQPARARSVEEWARWFETNTETRIVGRDDVEGQHVSTVFLGIDHAWLGGPPLLFETMIFGGPYDTYQWRWSTRPGAEAGHSHVVERLRKGLHPDPDGA